MGAAFIAFMVARVLFPGLPSWKNTIPSPPTGDHEGPPTHPSSTLAPTAHLASRLTSRLSLMHIGRPLRSPLLLKFALMVPLPPPLACSLLSTTGVHEVEHQGLFVVKDAGLAIFDYLVGEVEQRGDDLEAGLVAIILLAQYLKQM